MATAPPADAPPADEPKSLFEKMGAALPVALTAIATAFAGLSSSEMSQAMYWRSAAAQDQAKTNDQWSLAGFKRDRSLIAQSAAAQLRAGVGYRPAPPPADVHPQLATRVRGALSGQVVSRSDLPPHDDEPILAVLAAIHDRRPESEVVALARQVDRDRLDQIISDAALAVREAEASWDPLGAELERIAVASVAAAEKASGDDARARAAEAGATQAARYEAEYRRYRTEATLNQRLGFLYEVRVKTSTAQSDRHRERSKNFFYAMLAGQVGATVASLGLARQRNSALWAVAGIAGVVAVVFGVYVYLGM
jgi:hypothetical protein